MLFWMYGVRLACDRADEHPTAEDERQRERPESDQAVELRMGEPRRPGTDEHDPRAEGDEVQDAEPLVGRRMVGARLVVLIEAEDPGEDEPERDRQPEEEHLDGEATRAHRGAATENGVRGKKGDCQADDVGDGEGAIDDPASPPAKVRELTDAPDQSSMLRQSRRSSRIVDRCHEFPIPPPIVVPGLPRPLSRTSSRGLTLLPISPVCCWRPVN